VISDGWSLVAAYDSNYVNAGGGMDTGRPVENLTFTNNVVPNGDMVHRKWRRESRGLRVLPWHYPDSTLIAGYPVTGIRRANFYPAVVDFQAMFFNYAAGISALATSPSARTASRWGRTSQVPRCR